MIAIGDIIKKRRESLRFTQSELGRGICSTITISRIEAGKQEPTRSHFEAIMQRLGLSPSRYQVFIGDRELEAYHFIYEIDSQMAAFRYDEAERLVQKLEAIVSDEEKHTRQYIQYIRALIAGERDGLEAKQALLERALAETGPPFFETAPERLLLTLNEIGVLRNLADCLHLRGQTQQALDIDHKLIAYLKRRFTDPFEMATALVHLYALVSQYEGLIGDYHAALQDAEAGLELCLKYGRLHHLPHLLLNAGCARYHLDPGDRRGLTQMSQAYVLFTILDDKKNAALVAGRFDGEGLTLSFTSASEAGVG